MKLSTKATESESHAPFRLINMADRQSLQDTSLPAGRLNGLISQRTWSFNRAGLDPAMYGEDEDIVAALIQISAIVPTELCQGTHAQVDKVSFRR